MRVKDLPLALAYFPLSTVATLYALVVVAVAALSTLGATFAAPRSAAALVAVAVQAVAIPVGVAFLVDIDSTDADVVVPAAAGLVGLGAALAVVRRRGT